MKRIFLLIFSGAIFLSLKNRVCNPPQIVHGSEDSANAKQIYHISLRTLDGLGIINLSSFKGKKILIVNTASECGYTYQYEGLQKLQDRMKDKLVVIGCPCNQFGSQEPGDSAEIRSFCNKNYHVTFPLSEKLDVKGPNQHPLYKWLTQKSENGVLNSEVKWNFNKYLISADGKLMAYFPSKVKPEDSALVNMIEK
jgi:glutathione peroxidase